MIQDHDHIYVNNLLYSCAGRAQRGNEHFVHEHSLGYIISGEAHFITPAGTTIFTPGMVGLGRRNQLVKSLKVPPAGGGEYRAINIMFNQDILRRYAADNSVELTGKYNTKLYHIFQPDPFLKGYFESLIPYFDEPARLNNTLTELKTVEAIELLLRINPALKDFLFDFSEPHKIDLEAFMEQHYTYNVPLSDFAKLTGRSLAAFKRDFEKVYKTSPGQWLQQKRLAEAYYLIKEKGVKPSAAYLDVGFENLSHFSFAFKKAFGVSPSLLR